MYILNHGDMTRLESQICVRLRCETWDPQVLRTMHYRKFRSRCLEFIDGRGGLEWGECLSLGTLGLVVMAADPVLKVLEIEIVDTLPVVTELPSLLDRSDLLSEECVKRRRKT
jgi:hypothetical protein